MQYYLCIIICIYICIFIFFLFLCKILCRHSLVKKEWTYEKNNFVEISKKELSYVVLKIITLDY